MLAGPVLIADRFSPGIYWPAGFLSYGIPFIILINGILLAYTFFTAKWVRFIPHLLIVLLSSKFVLRTIAFHSTTDFVDTGKKISVLSYNVRVFNVYQHLHKEDPEKPKHLLGWINKDDSDIKCFQEFYNQDTSVVYNTLEKISQKGKYKYYFTKVFRNEVGAVFGIATFSKFPIVHHGSIPFEASKNKALYTDVLISRGDTLRIINVHFESIHMDEEGLFTYEAVETTKRHVTSLFKRLKKGFKKRAEQLKEVEKYILESRYPVILCGDINDLPYSYTYSQIKKQLYNAFEEAGNGFGFTYNGKIKFLRIDNQFFDPRLRILSFETLRDISFSDHYPIKGVYTWGD